MRAEGVARGDHDWSSGLDASCAVSRRGPYEWGMASNVRLGDRYHCNLALRLGEGGSSEKVSGTSGGLSLKKCRVEGPGFGWGRQRGPARGLLVVSENRREAIWRRRVVDLWSQEEHRSAAPDSRVVELRMKLKLTVMKLTVMKARACQ
jgi:hypothetical protein